jgi:hypothetical protein
MTQTLLTGVLRCVVEDVAIDVDVEVTSHDIPVVKVVVVDVVLVVVGVAAIAGGTKNCATL